MKRLIRLGGVLGNALGNPVIEIDGPFADYFTSLPWTYKDHWSGETATYRAAGYDLWARDYDGDYAGWYVNRGELVIATGTELDFSHALAKAEEALRADVRSRLKKLRAEDGR